MVALSIGWVAAVAPPVALAGPGSLITGSVWADANKDQLRQESEPVRAGVTVQLTMSPGGVVVSTTTTNASGVYQFPNVADGSYRVVVVAPTNFTFPATAAGDNGFTLTGPPAPGQPNTGQTAVLTVAGATQLTGQSAGLQPVGTIVVQQSPIPAGCLGLATTGTPPFDATDGGGKDSTASNCLVRTSDTTIQNFSVSLTGLPTGGSVANVVADFTITSDDGAKFRFDGPGGGLPTGCLTSGVTPASSVVTNPDGSVTLHCNMGTFTSSVKPISIPIFALPSSLDGSHFHLSVSVQAPADDAAPSQTVTGPDIQVTGRPQWDLTKVNSRSETTVSTQNIGGVNVQGYYMEYLITLASLAGAKGNATLQLPLSFTDKLNTYPNALLLGCRAQLGSGTAITCEPRGTAQGDDGWPMTITTVNATGGGGFVVSMFIPVEDAYRAIQPGWVTGDPIPVGSAPVSNSVTNTEGWSDANGQPNNGTGFEPGWDGSSATGNNRVQNAPLNVGPIVPPTPGTPGSGKSFFSPLGGCCSPNPATPGKEVGTRVVLNTNSTTTITNPMLCDVFDVSAFSLTSPVRTSTPPAGYVIEYAVGPNSDDLMAGPPSPTTGRFPFDSTPLKNAAAGCGTFAGPWSTTPTTSFGPNWQDTVNMIRMRPINPGTVLPVSSSIQFSSILKVRAFFNGGPHAGEKIPAGVQIPNEGGWTNPTVPAGWSTNEATLGFVPMLLGITKTRPQPQYLPGDEVPWTINAAVTDGNVGDLAHQLVVNDTLPANLLYDAACTEAALPAGVTVSFDPVSRTVSWALGDRLIVGPLPSQLPPLTLCTTVSRLARPGVTVTNTATVTSPDSSNTPSSTASIVINGTGALELEKSVDKAVVASGDIFTWGLDWANTSPSIDFEAPDLIDVLSWNGDGAAGSLSRRNQYESDFTGTHQLAGLLAQPTYTVGATGPVPGTWYYATAPPSTINHDPRALSNATPQAVGGLWQTAAEIQAGSGIAAVTAVRFVSAQPLQNSTAVHAAIPQVATSTVLNNVYVNRAQIFSPSFPDQPLLSNEPYVLMPGWSLGDLVWRDNNKNGSFDAADVGLPGIPIEVLDDAGNAVASTTTDADGRWLVEALPPGTYRAHIPASAFAAGQPLAGYYVTTVSSNLSATSNEGLDNNNTATPDPAVTGLTSAPVTFAYVRNGAGDITGGGAPTGDNVAGLGTQPLIPDSFTNFTVDLAVTPTPAISLVKSVVNPAPPGAVDTAGDVITYLFRVTNIGLTELTDVHVDDTQIAPAGPLTTGPTCPSTTLAAGASMDCTATYTVTQTDLDNGSVNDTATATGTPPAGDPVVSPPSTASVPVDQTPSLAILKTADVQTVSAVGDVITYSFLVTNTGHVTLADVGVDDAQVAPAGPLASGPTCPAAAASMVPGESVTCTATYVTTQADLDNGSVNDTATASGTPPTGPPVVSNTSAASVSAVQNPDLTILKSANLTEVDAVGDVITYSFLVTNTGTVTLTDVQVDDVQLDPAGALTSGPTCPAGAASMAPGDQVTCTATYTTTQADLDNGSVNDTATATGTPPTGQDVVSDPSEVSVPAGQSPGITLVKSADLSEFDAVGDVITYSFLVTNTGNVTLTDVDVDDVQVAPAGPLASGPTCPAGAASMAPGDTVTCTATYVTTQADLDHGSVDDTATASGTPPTGPQLVSDPSEVSVPAEQAPAITILKTADVTEFDTVGDVISYSFLVTNTGNVTLTDVDVDDVQVAPAGPLASGPTCPAGAASLAPGDTVTCTATYVTTQTDLDNGSVDDTATGTGTPPTGPDVVSDPSEVSVPAEQAPAITILKTADVALVAEVGDLITYSFLVTNTGNVTLTDVGVDDTQIAPAGPLASGPTCPAAAASMAPGDEVTCTATYVTTQADLDNGSINDTATASGTPPTGPAVVSDPSAASVDAPAEPALALVKAADREVANRAGDVVVYTFVVTNTGSVSQHDIQISDQLVAPAGPAVEVTCPPDVLAPGESLTCTSTPYTVTQADVDHGRIDNTATASGQPPTPAGGTQPPRTESGPSSDAVTIPDVPGIAMVKSVREDNFVAAGETLHFEFLVTNTGNTTLSDVAVEDPMPGLSAVQCPAAVLAPGTSMTCTATYQTTAVDVSDGEIHNSASVTGRSPNSVTVNDGAHADVSVDPSDAEGDLPDTGGPSWLVMALGFGLFPLGMALLLASRRRSPVRGEGRIRR